MKYLSFFNDNDYTLMIIFYYFSRLLVMKILKIYAVAYTVGKIWDYIPSPIDFFCRLSKILVRYKNMRLL